MTDCYTDYTDYVPSIVASGSIEEFRNNPRYVAIVENVTEHQGHEYMHNILTRFSCTGDDIIEYSEMNDRYGSPAKYVYLGRQISASTMRYFFHAMLILTYFNSKNSSPVRIVELGAGYGGLCLAINYCLKFFPELKISEYMIIDLEEPSKLQQMCLSRFTLSYPCKFFDAKNFGSEVAEDPEQLLFLISNYCFSEIPIDLQEKYQAILLPKTKHGFIAWNTPLRGFGKALSVEEEYPKTGPYNLYVRF
jgi:hypothetical protein